LATIAALLVERLAAGLAAIRPRRRIARRSEGPHLVDLLGLIAADIGGLAAFYGIFAAAERHLLPAVGVTRVLAMFSANVLIRWRVVAVINRAILRPGDTAARALSRFLSGAILAIIVLVGFGRYGLMDEDSGVPHVIGLINALLVCGIY